MAGPDVVIVGAGGGGAVAAAELAERGLEVLMLEAGPWLDPERDLTRLEDDMSSLADGVLRWGPGDRERPPWMRRRAGVGLILQSAGVGGTTLHYNGISVRAYPQAVEGGWPFPYRDLIPAYERVEERLPVETVRDLATKDALFAEGCEAIGLARSEAREIAEPVWRPSPNAILPIAEMSPEGPLTHPDVDGCTMCGHCLQGCPNPAGAPLERKAKRATNVSYVPAAVATGRCEVVPDAFVTAVVFEETGGADRPARVRGVRWRDTGSGEEHEVEAPVVVLAGGAIESPRLWLNSGLPNGSGAVGRYLTTHAQDLVTGFFDREVRPDVGQVTMARADFPGRGCLFTQGYGPQAFAVAVAAGGTGFWGDPTDGPWDLQGRAWGEEAARLLEDYHRSLTVLVCTDDEPSPENGVTLADDWPADEHGRVPKVAYEPTPRSLENQDWLAAKATEILRGAGARTVHRTRVAGALLTHLMGTLRMGSDPRASVVDGGGEAHEVAGLFVGDSSTFPNGLGGPNPTLTTQALATRVAEHVVARYSG